MRRRGIGDGVSRARGARRSPVGWVVCLLALTALWAFAGSSAASTHRGHAAAVRGRVAVHAHRSRRHRLVVHRLAYHGPTARPPRLSYAQLEAGAPPISSPAVEAGSASGDSGGLLSGPLVSGPVLPAPSGPVVGSATGYPGLSGSQALGVLNQTDSVLLAQPDAVVPALPSGWTVKSYVSHDVARVATSSGANVLLDSTEPIVGTSTTTGATAPVALGLISHGNGYAPAVTPAPVQIPTQLSSGVSLTGVGLGITPVDASGAALAGASGVAGGAAVAYTNTQTDTDTVVRPTDTGVDVLSVLRSPASPQQLYYRMSLPAGASVVVDQQVPGGFDVLAAGGKEIALIAPVSASDAAGASVPATVSLVGGSTLEVSLDESAGGYVYPITVDPQYMEVTDSSSFATGNPGWWRFGYYEPSGGQVFSQTANAYGLGICNCAGAMVNGDWGVWAYTTQAP
jgi:hypothetical protein